jgi:predicted dehydrogenase
MKPVTWGVLSTAKIARSSVIPSMQTSPMCEFAAISSRSLESAQRVASDLGIPKAYGSYEALLADPDIEAVYNPLPNHLHVPYTIKALEAGKHVLCEKPIAITGIETEELITAAARFPHLVVMEAFMYRFHPQWDAVKRLLREGTIGELKAIRADFTYFNTDPANVRNQADIGGGGILDIGCYGVDLCRFLFEREPVTVNSLVDVDPVFGTDRLATALMDFSPGMGMVLCSTQLEHRQSAMLYGTNGTIEIAIPFNAANEKKRTIVLDTGGESRTIEFEVCDQYVLQAEAFCRAVRGEAEVPIPLESSLATMRALDVIRA